MWIGHHKEIPTLTFQALVLSSEPIQELWVVCGLYTEIWCYAIALLHGNVKNNRI